MDLGEKLQLQWAKLTSWPPATTGQLQGLDHISHSCYMASPYLRQCHIISIEIHFKFQYDTGIEYESFLLCRNGDCGRLSQPNSCPGSSLVQLLTGQLELLQFSGPLPTSFPMKPKSLPFSNFLIRRPTRYLQCCTTL